MPQLSYDATANQINSTVLMTQIPRPSATDQALHDLFPTESAGVCLSNDRVLVKWRLSWSGTDHRNKTFIPITLDSYTIISRSTRPLLDQYPITSQTSWSLLKHLPTRSLLDFYDSQKLLKPDRCQPPGPLARPFPDCLNGLDQVDLMGSGNLAPSFRQANQTQKS